MQIVKIPRGEDKTASLGVIYKQKNGQYIDIVTAEDGVKVATLFDIYKAASPDAFLSKEEITEESQHGNAKLDTIH